jgi:hypothetical protein
MLSQLIYQLEASAIKIDKMSKKANLICGKKIKRVDRETLAKITAFTDFFLVEPSALDPYGLVKKIDQTIRQMEDKFTEFVEDIAADKSDREKEELNYALRAAIGLRQISKMVRHYVELAKKFKNLQIAMILKMQLPIIEKIAKGELKGTDAFSKGLPIGDGVGPMVAASLIEKPKPIAEDMVTDTIKIDGKTCFVLKATGPEPSLGRIDEAINKILKRNRIAKVITIDAAGKLEGEKTGSVAQGVGFAMGGFGQREIIENVLLPKKIPIDSIVVKVGMTEAIEPMKKSIADAVPEVLELVEASVRKLKRGQKCMIIGVGNSSGIGNDKASVEEAEKVIKQINKKKPVKKGFRIVRRRK